MNFTLCLGGSGLMVLGVVASVFLTASFWPLGIAAVAAIILWFFSRSDLAF